MAILLGDNEYGKAECRVVRVVRDTPRHEIRDFTVSTSLRGDFAAAHTIGDQADVLPTDTQKNTAYAYAKEHARGEIEPYALVLARHFVDDVEPVRGARVEVAEHAWDRITVDGEPHDHAFVRRGQEVRTTVVTVDGQGDEKGDGSSAWVVSGLTGLVVLKSTGSEFSGFLRDAYTTLPDTDDRIMATSLTCRWRYADTDAAVDWRAAYDEIRATLLARYADVHSRALQQTLWEMGRAVLEVRPEVVEIRLTAPNIHHFEVELARFGVQSRGEVFHVADRPYGLIHATVVRDDAPPPGLAWRTSASVS